MTYHDIDRIVARHFGVTVQEIHQDRKPDRIIYARSAAMYLCNRILKTSSKRLCKFYDKASHSTTLNALKTARDLMFSDPAYREKLLKSENECLEFQKAWPLLKQRYNLHYRVRSKGLVLDSKSKTVSITEDQIRILEHTQMQKLLHKHNYSIQFAIL